MTGLYNQSEKTNTIVFIILAVVYVICFSVYFKSYHFSHTYERVALGIFTTILIFGPVLYGLYSQNVKKSFLFAILTACPFLVSAFLGLLAMINGDFFNNFYLFVGSYLFSFAVFLVTGILTAWLGATYQPGKVIEIGFSSYKLPVYSLLFLAGLIVFSFLFLITGSLSFGIHIH
ncbi:hypothetical protein [Methanimicrococcus stummii]|nr:hypothetical protein [Methanimicrococcus sp. Es2]